MIEMGRGEQFGRSRYLERLAGRSLPSHRRQDTSRFWGDRRGLSWVRQID